jgi:RNA polymerase sigma-70 factor, ECF subfamily
MDDPRDVSRLILQVRCGDERALQHYLETIYAELRKLAGAMMRHAPPGQTLQPTALVHEACLRLMKDEGFDPKDRVHFFAIAARAMRQVLVDYARRKGAAKRGGFLQQRVEMTDDVALQDRQLEVVLAVDEVLDRLRAVDVRQAQIVEMHYYAGLKVDEMAAALDISERSVKRELQSARLFLKKELAPRGITL